MDDKCICCGVRAMVDDDEQPACGHRFCIICWGRDHHEYDECVGCQHDDDRRGEDRPEAA